jgi:OOP family OmpA-OmpF porin
LFDYQWNSGGEMKYMQSFFLLIIIFLGGNNQLFAQASQVKEDPPLMKSIFFGGGSYFIDEGQIIELKEFINNLPDLQHYTISIHSHTDNIGGADYNNWLSQMRSESVIYELVLQNIPIENIFIKDFGEFNPVFDNESYKGRILNRRVDILFEPILF